MPVENVCGHCGPWEVWNWVKLKRFLSLVGLSVIADHKCEQILCEILWSCWPKNYASRSALGRFNPQVAYVHNVNVLTLTTIANRLESVCSNSSSAVCFQSCWNQHHAWTSLLVGQFPQRHCSLNEFRDVHSKVINHAKGTILWSNVSGGWHSSDCCSFGAVSF